jgi:sortase A
MHTPTRDDNPLFDLPPRKDKVVQPLNDSTKSNSGENEAVELIRQKIGKLYAQEPSARQEIKETEGIKPSQRSKHQAYMHELTSSGKSLAEIQTAWHAYYVGLPNKEKHEVWQEFYANYDKVRTKGASHPATQPTQADQQHAINVEQHSRSQPASPKRHRSKTDKRSVAELQNQLLHKIGARTHKQQTHVKSLVFGLAMGSAMLIITSFGFFNERFIAPFMTPSRTVTSTPIIVDSTAAVGPEPKVIIPKINVEIPIVFDEPSINEDAVQRALEDGVLHYPTTPKPGELGNSVIFGHSSNNILNRGKYKFAFVLLNRLEEGDTFMLQHEGKRYVYRVFEKKVVTPDQVEVLGNVSDKPAVASLITCDPPGTSTNRLVVIGEQISPDPAGNIASSAGPPTTAIDNRPDILPSNSPSLWSRLYNWIAT